MAFYVDKKTSVFTSVSILIFSFIVCFQPWQLHFQELSRSEGLFAAAAAEMQYDTLPVVRAHDTMLNNLPPGTPWLSSILDNFLPMETAIRILPVTALAVLAVIAGLAARRAAGNTAGFTAAAMLISTNLVLEKFVEFDPFFCSMPFVFGGWLLWFYYGFQQSNWTKAWVAFALCTGCAVYTGGYKMFPIALIPLIFQRRPLSLRSKLKRNSVLWACLIMFSFIAARTLPGIIHTGTPFDWSKVQMSGFAEYGIQLVTFPFDFAIRLLPWGIISWAPFCVAYQWIAPAPVFGKFLRTIVISLFFVFWFIPGTEIHETAVLLAPLAVLTGIYAQYPVRKYGETLTRIFRFTAVAFCLLTVFILLLYFYAPAVNIMKFFTLERSLDFLDNRSYKLFFLASALAIALCAAAVLQHKENRLPLWSQGILLVSMFMLCWWGIVTPYRTQETGKRLMGKTLETAVAKTAEVENITDPVIYKYNINEFYSEAVYSGIPFKEIRSIHDIPATDTGIFLLTTEFPQHPEREWHRLLLPSFTYRHKALVFLYGKLRNNDVATQNMELEEW